MKLRKSPETGDEVTQRDKLFEAMSSRLQGFARKIDQKLALGNQGQILIAHEVGSLVNQASETCGAIDGDVLQKLADYTDLPDGWRTLTDYMKLSRIFSSEFLREQVSARMQNGKQLSLYHYIEAATISDEDARIEMLERIRRENLTVDQVRKLITAGGMRSCVKKGGGRKQNRPMRPVDGLHRLGADSKRIVELAPAMGAVWDQIRRMPPADVDEGLLGEVEAVEASATSAIESLHALLQDLANAKARVERVLSLRQRRLELQPA
jgi:hypothetical protein